MNNPDPKINPMTDDEMLPEYDFSQGIRGKHYQAYREGYTVTIHQEDGTTIAKNYTLEDRLIVMFDN